MYRYVEDPETYGSANNRLMKYELVHDYLGPISNTYYYYNEVGNVTRVVTEEVDPEPEEPKYSATRLVYGRNQTAVSYVMGETWEADGSGYTITYGREFRYDGARQRYLNRELDPVDLLSGTIKEQLDGDTRWSDYDGDDVYADFTIDVNDDVIVETWYEPGMARSSIPSDPAGTEYYHTNHLGTTRLMSNELGLPTDESAYSAFGESVAGAFHRYGYVGAHGYQTHTDFPFMHLGHRYYDPATGRFLQRDPIGMHGGVNVYGYVNGNPSAQLDPSGLFSDFNTAVPPGWTPGGIFSAPKPPSPRDHDDWKPTPRRPRPKLDPPTYRRSRIRRIIDFLGGCFPYWPSSFTPLEFYDPEAMRHPMWT